MGRLIAVVLFIAVLVPGVLLARAWWLASGRRAVAGGFSALAAGVAVAVFLLGWLRPVRANERALAS